MGGLFSTVTPDLELNNLDNNECPSMQLDPNYNLIINNYNTDNGFGDDRNTAIVIVGNFMKENDIVGNPQVFTDTELYTILTKKTTLIALLVINTILFKPQMQLDGNYDASINKYSKTFGFKGDRNTAITIVGNFMREQSIDVNPQSFSDNKLYNILTTDSTKSAIDAINTPEEEYTNKPVYTETWEI